MGGRAHLHHGLDAHTLLAGAARASHGGSRALSRSRLVYIVRSNPALFQHSIYSPTARLVRTLSPGEGSSWSSAWFLQCSPGDGWHRRSYSPRLVMPGVVRALCSCQGSFVHLVEIYGSRWAGGARRIIYSLAAWFYALGMVKARLDQHHGARLTASRPGSGGGGGRAPQLWCGSSSSRRHRRSRSSCAGAEAASLTRRLCGASG